MKKLIVVADWAGDDLYKQEVRSAILGYLGKESVPNISFVKSAFSSIHTGFLLKQISYTEERFGSPHDTVLLQGSDARANDMRQPAPLYAIRLKSGIFVVGPNCGFSYSFLLDDIDEAFSYSEDIPLSTFLSRDAYSRLTAHLMENLEQVLDLDEVHIDTIPGILDKYVGHIDDFGNLITTYSYEEIKGIWEPGETLSVTIGSVQKKVRLVKDLFHGEHGELILYPGSCGDIKNPFLEIAVYGFGKGTASSVFNVSTPGVQVLFSK